MMLFTEKNPLVFSNFTIIWIKKTQQIKYANFYLPRRILSCFPIFDNLDKKKTHKKKVPKFLFTERIPFGFFKNGTFWRNIGFFDIFQIHREDSYWFFWHISTFILFLRLIYTQKSVIVQTLSKSSRGFSSCFFFVDSLRTKNDHFWRRELSDLDQIWKMNFLGGFFSTFNIFKNAKK